MPRRYAAVVMGASAGGVTAWGKLLPVFPAGYPLPLAIVQHLHPQQDRMFLTYLDGCCALAVKEADEKEPLRPGTAYFAPPNYHLLIEADHTFSLSVDAKVNYSRPSIDVLFESAADAYGADLVGVLLSGANEDGARGLRRIKEHGGVALVQDPVEAEVPYMPRAALAAGPVDHILPLAEIGRWLLDCV